jgi:hypothetical protein
MARKALKKYASRSRSKIARRNPALAIAKDLGGEVLEVAVPGLVGYAGTRIAGRISRAVLAPRIAMLAKHAGPLGNLLAVLAAYFATKQASLRKYRTPVLVGSGIALFQTLLQTYFPGIAKILDDAAPVGASPMGDVPPPRRRRRQKIRYVNPGEITREKAAEIHAEQVAQGISDSEDELEGEAEPQDALDTGGEALPEGLLDEEEEMADLYGGVFKT